MWLLIGVIALFALIVGISHKSQTDRSNSETQQSTARVSTPQTQIVLPSVPPPKFRIYKHENDSPTSVVVPVHTTDEQLKSLLWFFREKVRSHEFKSIGVKEETDGVLLVYRGDKCANEEFINTNGPCGYGEHDDASYQWGIEGDYNNDTGSIRINGNDIVVFDYTDGWQVNPEIQSKLDEQAKLGQAQRELFAQQLQQKLTSMGYDISTLTEGEGDYAGRELTIDSEMFKDTATRVQFVNGVLPEWKKDLCRVGFQRVRLRRGQMFGLGQEFSLGCTH